MTATSPGNSPQPGAIEPLAEPTHQSLKDLHAYWLAKKGTKVAPPRSAIVPDEIVALLPYIALIDVVAGDPLRYRFRLFGTALVAAYGQDVTGKYVDEIDLNGIGPDVIEHVTRVVRECSPLAVRTRFTKTGDQRYVQYERIGLPLSEDGSTVNMILFGFAVEKAY